MTRPSRTDRRPRASAVLAGVLGSSLVLAACGGGGGGTSPQPQGKVSQAEIDKAMQKPTELTFWTWVPKIEKEVAVFEEKYPAIDVKVVNAGQGEPQYAKLRTALKAGEGAPDVAQIEFQYIPTFSITESLVDLRPYGAEKHADTFVDWTWNQVKGAEGQIWAYPQDSGPMGMLYRKDIFDKHGIEPPRTWEEFAQAARKLHKADPDVTMTNLASDENGVWNGLLWQAGAKPFKTTGPDSVAVAVNDEVSNKVADYWEPLVRDGVVSTDPGFTNEWFRKMARGNYATWLTAAWGPVFLTGSASGTAGKWRAAPLPQWDASDPSSGNWGGSTTAVIKGTDHPIAAAKFAEFLNTNPKTTKMFTTEQFFFPTTKALLKDPSFTRWKPDFYGGQAVNQVFVDSSNLVDSDFQWPPFMDQTVTDWDETVGKSLTEKGDVNGALDAWQKRITQYAENQGFNVSSK